MKPAGKDGGLSSWHPWGSCSLSCGGGTQSRIKSCINPTPFQDGATCAQSPQETQPCNEQDCPRCDPLPEKSLLMPVAVYSNNYLLEFGDTDFEECDVAGQNYFLTPDHPVDYTIIYDYSCEVHFSKITIRNTHNSFHHDRWANAKNSPSIL